MVDIDWSLFYSFIIPIIHNLPSNFISFQVVHWCQVDSIPKLRFPTKIQRSRLSPGKWRIVHRGKRASNGFAEARDRKISSPNQRIVFVPCINLYIFFKSNIYIIIYIYNYIYILYIYTIYMYVCMYMLMRWWIQIQIDGLLKPQAIEQVVSFTTKISNIKGMTLVDPSI
jgi:hypothetical protein